MNRRSNRQSFSFKHVVVSCSVVATLGLGLSVVAGQPITAHAADEPPAAYTADSAAFGDAGAELAAPVQDNSRSVETLATPRAAQPTNGWWFENNKWYYYRNAERLTGWEKVSGIWYYLDPADRGAVVSGTSKKIDGDLYLFAKSGAMYSAGWVKPDFDDAWYYPDSSGRLATGWKKINGWWYYFEPKTGKSLAGGAYPIEGATYLFDRNGAMYRGGWVKFDTTGEWYYAESSGALLMGWQRIGDYQFYLDPAQRGKMARGGVQLIGGKPYVFDNSGALYQNGWAKVNGNWYFAASNGELVQGWKTIGGWTYYFDPANKFAAVAGKVKKIDANSYQFDGNGALYQNKWIWIPEHKTWRYAGGSGVLASGWLNLSDGTYFLDNQTFLMKLGETQIGASRYFFDHNGRLKTGTFKAKDRIYKADNQGRLANSSELKEGWFELEGKWYWIQNGGKLVSGYKTVNGKRYYLKKPDDYSMAANEWVYQSDGTRLWADSSGELMSSTPVYVNNSYYGSFETAVNRQIQKRAGTDAAAVRRFMDPRNFKPNTPAYFQFMRLDKPMGLSATQINQMLKGKGALEGQGAAFKRAAEVNGLNEVYLVAHALHETGNGRSNLANNAYWNTETQTAEITPSASSAHVYNFFGIGAYDSAAFYGGTKHAYTNGWTTKEKAIIGGGQFVKKGYIAAGGVRMSGQNTLYKMLFHPEAHALNPANIWHQYATDPGWAYKQAVIMSKLLAEVDGYSLTVDVPSYTY